MGFLTGTQLVTGGAETHSGLCARGQVRTPKPVVLLLPTLSLTFPAWLPPQRAHLQLCPKGTWPPSMALLAVLFSFN